MLQHEDIQITKASLFVTQEAAKLVDLYYEVIPDPVLFEWNLLHSKQGFLATDMDGVICHDPPKGLDGDESAYVEWMRNARPYLVPLYEIDAIVSSRLERYRAAGPVDRKDNIMRDGVGPKDGRIGTTGRGLETIAEGLPQPVHGRHAEVVRHHATDLPVPGARLGRLAQLLIDRARERQPRQRADEPHQLLQLRPTGAGVVPGLVSACPAAHWGHESGS